jgi:lysylphosphatidylglycerol synthetase-like protein (DUF2156 family)
VIREQALKRAQKVFGKRAYIRANKDLSSPEERAEAQARASTRRAERAELEAEIARREKEAGIPELRAKIKAISDQSRAEIWNSGYYKFEVGNIDSILGAFHIKGQGDTWEEAFANAENK